MKKIILGIVLIAATAFTVMGCTSEVTGAPVANPAPVTVTETAPAPPPVVQAPSLTLAEKIDNVPGIEPGTGAQFAELFEGSDLVASTIAACHVLGENAYADAALEGWLEGSPESDPTRVRNMFVVVYQHYCDREV